MNAKRFWLVVTVSISLVSAAAAQTGKPLRFEGVGTYHYNGSVQGEYAFTTAQTSLGLDCGISYGIRDWWNSVSAGATWYPSSLDAEGFFIQALETYGFGISSIQGDSGRDWKTSMTLGYRWMAFGWLTGTVAAGANYDALVVATAGGPKDFNAGGPKGFNPAVMISLGVALDPRP